MKDYIAILPEALIIVLLAIVCGPLACSPATAPKVPKKAPDHRPRIEWPTAYTVQVHFPLYLDDEIQVCVEVPMPERKTGSNVVCEPLGVLRWQLTNGRSAK